MMTIGDIRQTIDESKLKRFHMMLLFWCAFIVTFEGYDLVVIGTIIPSITKEWSLGAVQAGIISSYGLLGMLVGSLIFGYFADKFGRINIIILSITLFSVFTALSGFANDPTFFSWCRLLAGLGIGGAMPNATALMSEYSPKASRNRLIAITLCGMQIGGVLAPLLGMFLIPEFGWRSVLWVAALPLLSLPFIYKTLPESVNILVIKGKTDILHRVLSKINPSHKIENIVVNKKITTKTQQVPISTLFKNRLAVSTLMIWVSYFLCLLMIYGLNTWLPNLMRDAGYSLGSSLSFLLVLNLGAIIGTLVLGGVADKFGSKKLLITLYCIGFISLSLLGVKNNMFVLYVLIAIAGICTMGAQNLLNAFTSQFYPHHVRSTALGFANAVGRIGGTLGPTLGGVLLAEKVPMLLNFVVFAIPGLIIALSLTLVQPKYSYAKVDPTSLDDSKDGGIRA